MEHKDMAFLSKKLATIKTDVEIDFLLKDARLHDFDRAKAEKFLQKYRFFSLIKRMPKSQRSLNQQESLF